MSNVTPIRAIVHRPTIVLRRGGIPITPIGVLNLLSGFNAQLHLINDLPVAGSAVSLLESDVTGDLVVVINWSREPFARTGSVIQLEHAKSGKVLGGYTVRETYINTIHSLAQLAEALGERTIKAMVLT